MVKKSLVLGGGGFIGNHMVSRLKDEGHWVRSVDLKFPEFNKSEADEFVIGDLRNDKFCVDLFDQQYDEVYQFAADMGGAGYIFTGNNDADVMYNSGKINLNIAKLSAVTKVKAVFYSSSACIYPEFNQLDPDNPILSEVSAYPAMPDSEYGWEKLFSERLYFSFKRNYKLNVHIARYHNIFGPLGIFDGGKEKAPAALCRKVAESNHTDEIEIWGDGKQTRSFLFVDECIEATRQLISSDFPGPVNIGSEEMVTINELASRIIKISGKNISIKHIQGPQGVRGRSSDNNLLYKNLKWRPSIYLDDGLKITYKWINKRIKKGLVQL